MKTRPIEPAQIEFGDAPGHVPHAPVFGDVYHPRVGGLAQARHVFLGGNGLPRRWGGRERFVILETGFGLGNNFLATWAAWRADPARCGRLHFVSVERHPPRRADLARAHAEAPLGDLAEQLLQAWPALTPNLHALDFEDGRVQLLLAFGDVADMLPALQLQADAFFLDGFAPARNPQMWQPRVLKALGRKAATGATLATWSVARDLREGLAAVGFEVQLAQGIGGKREITVAHWAPRFVPRAPPSCRVAARQAIVVGAGIAGAAVARALARQGLAVQVLDRRVLPAQEASGNPGGLFHGTVHPDDGPYARLFRAAALEAPRCYTDAFASGTVAGHAQGLLRLDTQAGGADAMRALLQRQGLPRDWIDALDANDASALAAVPLATPAWHYASGGWIAPAAWVRYALAQPGIDFRGEVDVAGLAHDGEAWTLHDAQGHLLASAPLVVLANAATAGGLARGLGHAAWPLSHTRGQVTHWQGDSPLRLPVAGDGYALPVPGGLLCGATRQALEPPGDARDAVVFDTDDDQNLQRLLRLTGLRGPADRTALQSRAGWRLHGDDRLPIAGALPLPTLPAGQRLDQARLLPRQQGLFVLTALGARGLTLAPLLGRLVAAQATGAPWPLEQDLADAVDPARWIVRAARASNRGGGADQAG